MYGKVFTEIFDSSLMAEGGWLPTYVFMCMVSMADKNGHLRHDPRTLYRRIGLSADDRVSFNEFMDAVEYLEREDECSNLPTEAGRRVLPAKQIDEISGNRGWLIVNYAHYRDKGGSIEQRRAQDAERKRRQREGDKSHVTVTAGHGESAHIDTDTDTEKKGRQATAFDLFWKAYPKKRKKKTALDIWKRKKLDGLADILIADVKNRILRDERWLAGFIPDPPTYLNQERWQDELTDSVGEGTLTLEQQAAQHGLTRSVGESDETLRDRIGVAQTKAQYGYG